MNTKLVIPLLLFALGNILTIHVIFSYVWQILYWTPVKGLIEEVVEKSLGDTSIEVPKIAYQYDGQTFSNFLPGWKSTVYIVKGRKVTVLVNPKRPENFSIKNWHNLVGPIIFVVILNAFAAKTVASLW